MLRREGKRGHELKRFRGCRSRRGGLNSPSGYGETHLSEGCKRVVDGRHGMLRLHVRTQVVGAEVYHWTFEQ